MGEDDALDQPSRWYRQHRDLGWRDWEADTNRELRLLFAIRRDAIRLYQEQQKHLRRAWFEAAESARWTPDAGDHFVWPS